MGHANLQRPLETAQHGTESDTYTSPSEECGQTRQGLEPGEHGSTVGRQVDVCDEGEHQEGDGGDERATGAVNIGEDSWSIALLG